jgi:hypothetical protein
MGRLPCQRDEALVILMSALPDEEIVIAATRCLRVMATDFRTIFVDGAATFSGVQKLANAFVDSVLAVAQNAAITFDHLGEALLGLLEAEGKAFGQALDVAASDDDVFV